MLIKFFSGAAPAAVVLLALANPAAQAGAGLGAPAQLVLPNFADLYDRVSPAVVSISASTKVRRTDAADEQALNEFFQKFTPSQRVQTRSTDERGAGFLISADGYLLTTEYVVAGADKVLVTLADGRVFKAALIGTDKQADVALLRIAGSGLPYLQTADSSKIRTGEWVFALGAPFKLNNSITAGIISLKSRETGAYLPSIQSDVTINPGSAGGPLLNLDGEVIDINSQIYSHRGTFSGAAFSTPINEIMQAVKQLRAHGKVARGRIGVEMIKAGNDKPDESGLPPARGATIEVLEQGGPAEQAGMRVGDVILVFDGHPVADDSVLARVVGDCAPGSRVQATIMRKGAQQELMLTIAAADQPRGARNNPAAGGQ